MNIIDTSQIVDPATEQPWTGPSLAFLQAANSDMIQALAQSFVGLTYSSSTPYALVNLTYAGSVTTPTNIFGGYILWQNELFVCGGRPTPITIAAQFSIQVTPGAPDPLTFSDLTTKNVHNVRKLAITDAASGGLFTLSQMQYIVAPGVVPTIANATIINSWTNFVTVKYFKSSSAVLYMDGVITGAAGVPTSTIMFNLPVGFRPTTKKICSIICNDAGRTPQYEPCLLRVNTNGDVEALPSQSAVGTQSIYLAGVSIQLGW